MARGEGLGAGGAAHARFANAGAAQGNGINHYRFGFNDWLEANKFFNCYPRRPNDIGQALDPECPRATKAHISSPDADVPPG